MQLVIDFMVMKIIGFKAELKRSRCTKLHLSWGCRLRDLNYITGDFWVDTQTYPRPYLMTKHARRLLNQASAQFGLATRAKSRRDAALHYAAGLKIFREAKAYAKVAELTHETPSIFDHLNVSSRAKIKREIQM